MEQLQNYINGKLQPSLSAQWLDNYEPATGQVYSHIPDSDASDVELAVTAAKAAFSTWSATPLEERMMTLLRIADGIERRMDEFVIDFFEFCNGFEVIGINRSQQGIISNLRPKVRLSC